MKNEVVRNWCLIVEYDGSRYCGWQIQPDRDSVQAEIVRALIVVLRTPIKLTGAGRTDAGVHASGQTANFKTHIPIDPGNLRWRLNALLPGDIVVREVLPAKDDFNARRSAVGRTYCYRILNQPFPSAFWSKYSWWISKPLDLGKMRTAAVKLAGTHDFSGFTVAKEGTMVRNIEAIEISVPDEASGLIVITVAANAFLHHMVRLIVGTLVEIGAGKRAPRLVDEILKSKDVRMAGPRAPAKGLRLDKVRYPPSA